MNHYFDDSPNAKRKRIFQLTAVSKEVTLLIRFNIATSKCW